MKFFYKSLFLISVLFSCKNDFTENKEKLNKAINDFAFYRKDSVFTSYIFKGHIPKYANEYLEESKIVRLDLGLNDISKGVSEGFVFGFHFNFNESFSYYLQLDCSHKSLIAKLFKSKFEYISQKYNKTDIPVGYNKRVYLDSFNLKPKSGWTYLLNELYLLRAHELLNFNDPEIKKFNNTVMGMIPFVYFEFANKNHFRIALHMRFISNQSIEHNIRIDKIIKLLYNEFRLKKFMDKDFWL